ncbi:MAG: hypothetical protein JJE27_02370 [Thermoleophilia bacterium]|nr:hypothetical protein [Thermoleophilia bacterium]
MSRQERSAHKTISFGLEVCPACHSDLVQPVEARAQNDGGVRLTLRCPECEYVSIDNYGWEAARNFGRVFLAGKALLRAAHAELAKENLLDELDCFVLALAADLIGPDDFKPYRYDV